VHYRDLRNRGMVDEVLKVIDRERLYNITGNQIMEINTAFQLYWLATRRPHILGRADKMLLTPDLLNYMLTGVKSAEYSIASTTQLLDARTKTWSDEVIGKLGIPRRLFADVVPAGTVIGKLSGEICEELDVPAAQVISVASHDTQSAVAAVPTEDKDFIFISCGTWSLFGTELDAPLINETTSALNITNEGGYGGRANLLKNIIGLWLIQESRLAWQRQGRDYSYAELEALALKAEPFVSFIDPDAPEFVPSGNLPRRISEFCQRTGQPVPQTPGEVMRCIYQSLALKYRYTFEKLRQVTGRDYPRIHLVGGGTKDNLLCQMTADSCNRDVIAGPIEATVYGNIAVQLLAAGAIKDLAQARELIAASQPVDIYKPMSNWDEAYKKFLNIIEE